MSLYSPDSFGNLDEEFYNFSAPAIIQNDSNSEVNKQKMEEKKLKKQNHIKIPMNAFMVWAQINRKIIAEKHPQLSNLEVSKLLGNAWNKMSDPERKPFIDKAKQLRAEHFEKYPKFKYQPRRRKRKSGSRQNIRLSVSNDHLLPKQNDNKNDNKNDDFNNSITSINTSIDNNDHNNSNANVMMPFNSNYSLNSNNYNLNVQSVVPVLLPQTYSYQVSPTPYSLMPCHNNFGSIYDSSKYAFNYEAIRNDYSQLPSINSLVPNMLPNAPEHYHINNNVIQL